MQQDHTASRPALLLGGVAAAGVGHRSVGLPKCSVAQGSCSDLVQTVFARCAGTDAVGETPGGFGPSQQAIAGEVSAKFEAGPDRLDEDQREVILMARVIGMSSTEIALELGIAEGAARTRWSRSLARSATLMAGCSSRSSDWLNERDAT
jgi:Sigma-70, region 4